MKNRTYEENLERLVKINTLIEDENTGIDESVALFKEAAELCEYMDKLLGDYKSEVNKIMDGIRGA